MEILDKVRIGQYCRDDFIRKIEVSALSVPKGLVSTILGLVCNRFFIKKVKRVVEDPSDTGKRLILINDDGGGDVKGILQRYQEVTVVEHTLYTDYTHCTIQEILDAILPRDLESITSFETVGHIAHVNLREEHIPYEHVIGRVILDKNANITTVVRKTSEIDNMYRILPMKVIAGRDDFVTTVKENDCFFHLDYSKVYWNSRLEHEHGRLTTIIDKGDVVFDVFAGIGPFSIPLAKKGCLVYSNDLNPDSHYYLNLNIERNKIKRNVITTFSLDGGEFIKRSEAIVQEISENVKIHYIMNLPAISVQFLHNFREISLHSKTVWIHCYLFSKKDENPKTLIETAINKNIDGACNTHCVRSVSPNKDMHCVSFRLGDISESLPSHP